VRSKGVIERAKELSDASTTRRGWWEAIQDRHNARRGTAPDAFHKGGTNLGRLARGQFDGTRSVGSGTEDVSNLRRTRDGVKISRG
jgi:hypothetical protein